MTQTKIPGNCTSKETLSTSLLELTKNKENRTETARLREVFDAIETAISAGVTRNKVLETLHTKGFTMKLKTFENAIYRIRKERAQQN